MPGDSSIEKKKERRRKRIKKNPEIILLCSFGIMKQKRKLSLKHIFIVRC